MAACLLVLYRAPTASAETRACTAKEAQEAGALAATATSWKKLHQQFEHYGHCDDGEIAEGFSESVTVLLDERWGNIKQLPPIIKSDPAFRTFIIRHINESAPAERLKGITRNARKRCPVNIKELCRDIQAAVP